MGSAPSKEELPEESELATDEGTITQDDYPPAQPPTTTKLQITKGVNFKSIDKFACNVPPTLLFGSFWDLIEHLVMAINFDVLDDMYRARALFSWMTSYNVNNIDTDIIPPENSPLDYFTKIRWDFGDHAHLLYALCLMAKLPCVIVNGVTKHGGYNIGDPIDKKIHSARWNAVLIKGEWRLIDVYWAISTVDDGGKYDKIYVDFDGDLNVSSNVNKNDDNVQRVNEAFFLADPESLIYTHFPDDLQWQLLSQPITLKQFERQTYIRERFHDMGISLPKKLQDKPCVLLSNGKSLRIPLDLPEKRSKDFRFKYTLVQTGGLQAGDNRTQTSLERHVMMQHALDRVQFTLNFPCEGMFRFDIFGMDATRTEPYSLITSYAIKCKAATPDCQTLPDIPLLGWGPNPAASALGLTPATPVGAIINTDTGVVDIKLKTKGVTKITHKMKSVHVEEAALSRYAVSEIGKDDCTISVRIPMNGEYGLNIYATTKEKDNKKNRNRNLLSFLIRCEMKVEAEVPAFPNVLGNQVGMKSGADELGVVQNGDIRDRKVAVNGKITLQFTVAEDVSLHFELHSNDTQGKNTMTGVEERVDPLCNYIMELPVAGMYAVNVFGTRNETNATITEVYSCIIQSEGNSGAANIADMKRAAPTKKNRNAKASDNSKTGFNETIYTTTSSVKVPMPVTQGEVFPSLRRNDATEEGDTPAATVIVANDNTLEIRMKVSGDYLLDLFSKESTGNIKTIGRYTITYECEFDNDSDGPLEEYLNESEHILASGALLKMGCTGKSDNKSHAVKKPTRKPPVHKEVPKKTPPKVESVRKPPGKKDFDELVKCLNRQYHTKPIPADIGLDAWFDAKDKEKAMEDITKACSFRKPVMLEEAIERAVEVQTASGEKKYLDTQIRMAARVLKTVTKVEKNLVEFYGLHLKSMTEIKRYQSPPLGVHHVVAATFLLLGEDIEDLKKWSLCRRLLSQMGNQFVFRRMAMLDPVAVPPLVIETVNRILQPFTAVQIREASKEAATLHAWIMRVVRENENTEEQSPSRHSHIPPRSSNMPEHASQ
ncbi:uncharacterized protein LOC117325678 [Pecten maximus]|uniref:uncharacterized protein LOC117325678 n=1 Tax=Pecten maximus TaxID=6579 RepID=UPI001458646C|nr:uncharacterized protein LOC117325678 [Pecten maximus]